MCVCSHMLFCASLSGSGVGEVTISGSAPCRAHSGRTWMGGLKGVKTSVECGGEVWGGGRRGWGHRKVVTPFRSCKMHTKACTMLVYTNAHTLVCAHMHTTQPTCLLQLLHHLPPKWLHLWVAFCSSGHLTILHQSVHTGVMCQVLVQDLLCILIICCSIDVWHHILCDHS